jgi:hypothetical protein
VTNVPCQTKGLSNCDVRDTPSRKKLTKGEPRGAHLPQRSAEHPKRVRPRPVEQLGIIERLKHTKDMDN